MHARLRRGEVGPAMSTAIHRVVDAARAGQLARVIARMPSGWAVLGDPQIRPAAACATPTRSCRT
jgi:hypothetical protein